MDWYQNLFGRPAPGRRAEPAPLNYLRDPEEYPEVEQATRTRDEVRRSVEEGPRAPMGVEAELSYELERRRRGVQDTPLANESAARRDDVRPFGTPRDYFDAREAATRRASSDIVRNAPAYRAPRSAWGLNTETGTGGNRYGARDLPRERELDRLTPPSDDYSHSTQDLDPTQEWIAAEERAAERWRRQRPTTADRFFSAVFSAAYGGPSRAERDVAADNEAMRGEIAEMGGRRRPERSTLADNAAESKRRR